MYMNVNTVRIYGRIISCTTCTNTNIGFELLDRISKKDMKCTKGPGEEQFDINVWKRYAIIDLALLQVPIAPASSPFDNPSNCCHAMVYLR